MRTLDSYRNIRKVVPYYYFKQELMVELLTVREQGAATHEHCTTTNIEAMVGSVQYKGQYYHMLRMLKT